MRDGIPRTLPVPRKWQAFVECADRTADRGTDRVVSRLCEAILSDMRRDFPTDVRENLKSRVSQIQPMFSGLEFSAVRTSDTILAKGQSHRLTEALTDARAAVESGLGPAQALKNAIAHQMEASLISRRRQITEDLTTKIPAHELKRFLSEFDRAAACIDAQSEADRFLKADSEKGAGSSKICADEELRRI